MTRAEITRLAKAKHGKKVVVQENKGAVDPDTREICRREYMALKEREPKAPPPTPEQQAYRKAWAEWKEQMGRLRGHVFGTKRYRILVDRGWAMEVVGDGDSWEEAATKAGLTSPA